MAKPLKALKEVLDNLLRPHVTHAYPHVKKETAKKFRARIKFKPENCIGCQLCVKDCPTDALRIENTGTKENKKFDAVLELDRCIFCAQCIDSCRKGSLSLTPRIELAELGRDKMRSGI
ncbi:MAG: 4Fe-4S dicluster domain-containing protein [Clostridiales bacterium]|nr:4Fe-4S dicluster domain-containing protein [Clostridiales bacterium]